jgi:hypothetical protein
MKRMGLSKVAFVYVHEAHTPSCVTGTISKF